MRRAIIDLFFFSYAGPFRIAGVHILRHDNWNIAKLDMKVRETGSGKGIIQVRLYDTSNLR